MTFSLSSSATCSGTDEFVRRSPLALLGPAVEPIFHPGARARGAQGRLVIGTDEGIFLIVRDRFAALADVVRALVRHQCAGGSAGQGEAAVACIRADPGGQAKRFLAHTEVL